MPTVGQAPAVVPIPELSEEEKQERLDDLEMAFKLHKGIREKAAKVLPQIEEIFRDFAKLQDHCSKTQSLRIIRLGRILMTDPLAKLALAARFHLHRLGSTSERAERNAWDMARMILDPEIVPPNRPVRRKPEKIQK